MSKQLLTSIVVGGFTFVILACNNDAPTSNRSPAGRSNDITTATANACVPNPPGRPGRIFDTVTVPSPWGVAVRDDGLTFFTEPFNSGVGVTSTRTRTVNAFIPTGPIPTGIAFSPDGSTAYVANQSGDVSVLDAATQTKVGSISIPNPLAVHVSPDGTQLFVATGGTSVYIVDIASQQVTKTVSVGFAPNGFAVDPDGRILYVSSFIGGSVTEIDMFTGTALRTFFVGGTPQELATNRKGTHLYVANEAGYMNDIDLTTGQSAQPIPLQGGGFGLGVTPDDGEAYVTIPNAGVVQIFSLQNGTLTATLNVGGNPRRVAFSQQGHIGAITNTAGYLSFVR